MSSETTFTGFLKRIAGGETLSAEESTGAFSAIMRGTVPEMQMAALLTALAIRKPTIAEITGAVQAMRGAMLSIKAPPRRHRHVRDWRRRAWHAERLHRRLLRGGGLRCAGGEARQPQYVVPHRRG
jgi:hypothetical protein